MVNPPHTITGRLLFLSITVFLFLLSPSFIYAQVVINEFSPVTDTEWVEFYNASSSAEYIKTYYIDDDTSFTDDGGNSSKRSLTTLITSDIHYPTFEVSSFLNNKGDAVVLFDPNGVILDQYEYGDNLKDDQTIGRFPDQNGNFSLLSFPTRGFGNSAPLPTPDPTPTPAPTPTSSPAPTPKPTSTPVVAISSPVSVKRPSPSSQIETSIKPESTPEILGISESLISPLPEAETKPAAEPINPGIFIMVGGICVSAAAGFLAYQKMQKTKLV